MKYTNHDIELKPGTTITIPDGAKDIYYCSDTYGNPWISYRAPVPLTPLQRAAERADWYVWSAGPGTFSLHLHGFTSREEAQAALDSLKAGDGE